MRTKTISVSKYLVLGVISLILGSSVSAQDIHFSQLFENPLSLNPALGGAINGSFLAEVNYRNQWSSVAQNGNGYTTMALNTEFHNMLKNWGSGYLSPGLSVYEDESGDAHLTDLEVAFNLASGIYLNSNSCISAGLQGGWAQNSVQLNGLEWDDQYINGIYNPNANPNENYFGQAISYADFSGGIAYHYGTGQTNMSSNDNLKFSAGAAVYHINEPSVSFYNNGNSLSGGTALYRRYTFYTNMQIGVPNSNLTVLPAVIYMQQGPAWEVDAGAKLRYVVNPESQYTGNHKGSALDIGVYYRVNDAAIALLGYEWGNYALGVSYDFNTSALTTASHGEGGFEISLKFVNLDAILKTTGTMSRPPMF